jgi:hypothetical protein
LLSRELLQQYFWIVILNFLHGPIGGLVTAAAPLRFGAVLFILLITGWLLGSPLAAGLRLVGEWDPATVTWCWGANLSGWAVGGALATLMVYYVGVAKLWPMGLASFAIGAVLLAVSARDEPPHRWYVRQLR